MQPRLYSAAVAKPADAPDLESGGGLLSGITPMRVRIPPAAPQL
jgi:hypothetical protein